MRRVNFQIVIILALGFLFLLIQPERKRTTISDHEPQPAIWEDSLRFREHQNLCGETNAINRIESQANIRLLLKQKARKEEDCIRILNGDFPDFKEEKAPLE